MLEQLGPLLSGLLAGGMDESSAVPGMAQQIGYMNTPPDAMAEAPAALPDQAQDIIVKGWKPKERSFLGRLADGVLLAYGKQPMNKQRIDEKNMQDAMRGFTQDPLEAIGRMRQVNPQAAWQMYNQYADNARADAVAQRQADVAREAARDRIGAMMGAGNAENWDKMVPVMRRYAEARGIDPNEIPDVYDPVNASAWRMGALDVDDQLDNDRDDSYKGARLNQIDRAEEGRNARNAYNQDRQDARAVHTQDRQDARHSQTIASRPQKGEGRYVRTKYGMGSVSPSGSTMRVKVGDSYAVYAAAGPDKWEFVEYKPIGKAK